MVDNCDDSRPKWFDMEEHNNNIDKSLDKLLKDILKDYKPYIVKLNTSDGLELYQINGDNNLFYITGKAGAEEADRLLRKAAEQKYGK